MNHRCNTYHLCSYERSSNINRTFFLKCTATREKQNHFTGSYAGDTYNRYNASCRVNLLFVWSRWVNKWFFRLLDSALETCWVWWQSEHSSVKKCSQGPRYMTAVSYLKKDEYRLKPCEDYTFCRRKLLPGFLRTLKASCSSIFWQNNEPSTQFIIQSFLKTE
jgi:hypothetical protein